MERAGVDRPQTTRFDDLAERGFDIRIVAGDEHIERLSGNLTGDERPR